MRGGKPASNKNRLSGASAHALREFMIAKQREWEAKENGGAASDGALPLHQAPGRSEGDENATGGGLAARLWRRKRT